MKPVSHKARVKKRLASAFCVRLSAPIDGCQFIVWPTSHVGPRGAEQPACGLGKTARAAWASVKFAR